MKRLLLLAPAVVGAADLEVTIEIPRLEVAAYHRPYVAAWIEGPDRKVAANLEVWYDTGMANEEGETWLKDLRQWWRKAGRSLELPADGLSSPTRPPGTHKIQARDLELPPLAEGEYKLVVEASREVGGRELLRIPFAWNGAEAVTGKAAGERELGAIELSLQPK